MFTRYFISIKSKHRYLSFTLIELLVCIAIIAILAAVLFPMFAKAGGPLIGTLRHKHQMTGDPLTDALQLELDMLPKGEISIDAPKQIAMGESDKVVVHIKRGVPSVLKKAMVDETKNRQVSTNKIPHISGLMDVRLEGDGAIDVLSKPEKQFIDKKDGAYWSFVLTPKSEGIHDVNVIAYVYLNAGGKESDIVAKLPVFTQRIRITSTFFWHLKSLDWKYVITTLLGASALITTIYIWIRKKLTKVKIEENELSGTLKDLP